MVTNKKTRVGRLTEHVWSFYGRQRAPVAVVLVGVITVASILSYLPLQIAATIALLSLILQLLFEINEKITETTAKIWYPSFQAALPDMTGEITRRLRHRSVRMQWVGVTQEAGWPFSQNLLLEIITGGLGKSASLNIELALLDPDGQVCQRPDGPDKDQLKSTMEKISRFTSSRRTQLRSHGSSITVYMYDYRPTWHALLVDDDLLYFSTAMPENLPFAAPQGGVEVVRADHGEAEAERIRHLTAWFTSIISDATASGKLVSSKPKVRKRR